MPDKIQQVLNQLKLSTPENADWVLDRFREELGDCPGEQVAFLQQEVADYLADEGLEQAEREWLEKIEAAISFARDFLLGG